MEQEASFWVIESGRDCDGSYTRGRVWPFVNGKDAVAYCDSASDWSDGLQYYVIHTYKMLEQYCEEYMLDAEMYYYVK
jgi:hypothetical protein